MIPQQRGNSFSPFLKTAELKKGAIVTITDEFKPPESEKIQSFLIGEVNSDGILYTLGINPTTYRELSKTLGSDTAGWIGKKIKFAGKVSMGKGMGYLWTAV